MRYLLFLSFVFVFFRADSQSYPPDSVRPVIMLRGESAVDSQHLIVSMPYLGRPGQFVSANLQFLKDRGWFDGGGAVKPQPVNSIEYLTDSLILTVCNDTCSYKTIAQALEASSFYYSTFDSTGSKEIVISIRRNADGSVTTLKDRTSVENSNFSFVTITSKGDSVLYDSQGSPDNFFYAFNSNPPKFSDFSIYNIDRSVNMTAFRYESVQNPTFLSDTIVGFGRGIRCDEATNLNIRDSYIKNNSFTAGYDRGLWIENVTPFFIFSTKIDSFKNTGVRILRGSSGTIFSCDLTGYDESIFESESIELSSGSVLQFQASQARYINMSGGTLFGHPANTIDSVNILPNILTPQGLYLSELDPYPFQESSTANEPAASSGIRYYFNTDENATKVAIDSTWRTLGVLSNLPENSQAVDANDNALNITNVSQYQTSDLDGTGVDWAFQSASVNAIPTRMYRNDAVGESFVRLQNGQVTLFDQDVSQAYTLDQILRGEIQTGTAAPTSTPEYLGQIFIDTSANKIYMAAGTSGSGDWKQISN